MKTAIIYARVSADKDDKSTTTTQQIADCKALAQKEGYTVIGTFKDEGISGRTYPKGCEMLFEQDALTKDYLKNKRKDKLFRKGLADAFKMLSKVDVILCRDITRFYRPVASSLLLTYLPSKLIEHNVDLHTLDNGLTAASDIQKWIINQLFSGMVSEEIKSKSKKAQDEQDRKRNKGLLYTRPWKYGIRPSGKKHEITYIKNEVAVIKEIGKQFLKGWSVVKIVNHLNNKGIKTLSGKRWYNIQVKSILTCLSYYGKSTTTEGIEIDSKVTAFHEN